MAQEYTDTEEKIFLAALEVFGKEGRNGARMQQIADLAGINKALVHYYFRSKDKLYEEVMSYVVSHFLTDLGGTLENSDKKFDAVLREFVAQLMELLVKNPSLPVLLMREFAEGGPVFRAKLLDLTSRGIEPFPRRFMKLFQQAIERGEVRSLDPLQTMITVLGSCVYYFVAFPVLSVLEPGTQNNKEEFTRQRKEHVADILLNGILPRQETAQPRQETAQPRQETAQPRQETAQPRQETAQ